MFFCLSYVPGRRFLRTPIEICAFASPTATSRGYRMTCSWAVAALLVLHWSLTLPHLRFRAHHFLHCSFQPEHDLELGFEGSEALAQQSTHLFNYFSHAHVCFCGAWLLGFPTSASSLWRGVRRVQWCARVQLPRLKPMCPSSFPALHWFTRSIG